MSHRYDALGLLAPLFRRHCEPMVAATTTLFRALRPAHAKAAAAAAAAGTEADAFGAALAAAAASPRSVADALRCMLPRLLRATVRLSSTLWANGAPQFVLASLCSPAIRPPPLGPPPAAAAASSSSSPPEGTPPPLAPLGLLPLPSSFESVLHDSLHLPCELCSLVPASRALCLSCGACVCGLETLHGPRAVITHSQLCGGGVSLFLLTHTSAVLLVRDKRVSLLGSPYRDTYGETDLGLMRGRPLTLDRAEYALLSRQWLGLTFPETARDESELW